MTTEHRGDAPRTAGLSRRVHTVVDGNATGAQRAVAGFTLAGGAAVVTTAAIAAGDVFLQADPSAGHAIVSCAGPGLGAAVITGSLGLLLTATALEPSERAASGAVRVGVHRLLRRVRVAGFMTGAGAAVAAIVVGAADQASGIQALGPPAHIVGELAAVGFSAGTVAAGFETIMRRNVPKAVPPRALD